MTRDVAVELPLQRKVQPMTQDETPVQQNMAWSLLDQLRKTAPEATAELERNANSDTKLAAEFCRRVLEDCAMTPFPVDQHTRTRK